MGRKHQSLIDLVHDLVLDCPLGAKVVAERIGKGHVTLLNELNESQTQNKFGLRDLIPLMHVLDTDEPVHYLARERGGVFIKLPKARGMGAAYRAAVAAAAEFGACMEAFGKAISLESEGGEAVTESEMAFFEGEAHMALTAMVAFLETVRATAREKVGK